MHLQHAFRPAVRLRQVFDILLVRAVEAGEQGRLSGEAPQRPGTHQLPQLLDVRDHEDLPRHALHVQLEGHQVSVGGGVDG